MNQVIETIHKRRSTRAYEKKLVPRDIIVEIIKAGNQAPFASATRSQPWRFVVAINPKFKKKLVQTTLPIWKHGNQSMKKAYPEIYEMGMILYNALDEPKDPVYYSAPVIIFVIGPKSNDMCCSLACENMMIAATSLGLGNCYVGFGGMVKGNSEISKTLELKKDERIYGPILIGYPKINPSEALDKALENIKPNKKEPTIKWI